MTVLGQQEIRKNLAVILLNWNGWRDTIECLESLKKSTYKDFTFIVVDNGSTDGSLKKIRKWAEGSGTVPPSSGKQWRTTLRIVEIEQSQIPRKIEEAISDGSEQPDFVLIRNSKNLGFAGGNNVGIHYALNKNYDKIFLLNNDTTVAANCLEILSNFIEENKKYAVVTPMICYYDEPDNVWNCGGKLTWWGSRNYYHRNQKADQCPVGHCEISFITGCALMARADIFRKYGLLSEQFFLGEEDYEFSLRMQREGIVMAAVPQARIFHKVSQAKESVFRDDALPSAFIHHLNRFIDLKEHYRPLYWKVWRIFSLAYIIPMLRIRHGVPLRRILKFSGLLIDYSTRKDSVTSEDFFQAKELFNER
ncbi:MAG: glycosyltransferase family 2 protein [Fidelibacterota bacterium]